MVNSSTQGWHDASKLVQQGRELYQAGQFSEAATVWQQAAQAYLAQKDRLNQAMVLSNLSNAYQQLGKWSQATTAITDSLKILRNRQDVGSSKQQLQILAQAMNTQGSLQLALGQSEQALTTWQQAEIAYAKAGDRAGVTLSLINQAQALQALGLYRRALVTLNQVNQTLGSTPDSPLKLALLRNLGNALRVVGDLNQSRQVLQQSLVLAQQLKSSAEIGATLFSLGNTARSQQDTKAALAFYQQAANTFPSQITKIQTQLNQLSLLVNTQQLQAARALLPQIQSQLSTLPHSQIAVYARIDLAQSLMKLGARGLGLETRDNSSPSLQPPAPSPSHIAQLLATAVQQAKSLGDRRAEAYALANLGGVYEQNQQLSNAQELTEQALQLALTINAPDIAYRSSWQLGRILKAQGDAKGAIAAYTEAVNNLKSLRSDLVAIDPDIQFDFRDEVEPVYRQLVDLLLKSEKGSQPSQQNLKQARDAIESLQLAELDNFFRSACLDAKRYLIDQVVDREEHKAAVIYPIILPDRLEIILKLPKQEKLYHYTTPVAQEELESTLTSLREYLLDVTQTSQVKKQSQRVYEWLIEPVEAQLTNSGINTLVFVLDGSLRNIPMAVLYDNKRKQYLVEKHAIALAPGLQLIEPNPWQRVQLNALVAGVDAKRQIEGREFARLKNVRIELQQIQSEVPSSEQLFNQAFTKINLRNQLKSEPFSVVHIATHGEFSSDPEKTFILTWDQLLKVKDFDNLLRVSNQSRSKAIDLLVLSACETAQGDNRAALGLAGVAVRAGARSTLATLWSVDDQSTTDFMSQFYQELTTGVTKAEALQRAQLAIFASEKRPYFWAPYVLLGNWL